MLPCSVIEQHCLTSKLEVLGLVSKFWGTRISFLRHWFEELVDCDIGPCSFGQDACLWTKFVCGQVTFLHLSVPRVIEVRCALSLSAILG
jgi:hypothetical protein